ncbi:MAG: hypothetical protein A2782_00940 [Candidatus Blackburnbacteria bacterium RIFCSPHIGHO2_01_FULL_43_15b]|uniref:Uncharacterized protein n=1 Tax=Candidatus Blackburnbacteria bacterium RIFCSPHIGHO2_01_FULL_43_15b TaxID=1797513 RepID=A0A1G1V0Z3_9BACT|nr:MAG: hypothetical protein A2782_00940 [Candidatus Blackburnbacteria bacterium RIFCSPHIGHO2_01_FULL_43_15b]
MLSFELNDNQLDRISEFLGNFSILILATLVIPNVFGVDTHNFNNLMSGTVVYGLTLLASVIILRSHD